MQIMKVSFDWLESSEAQPQLCHIRPPWNAAYKANAAGKKVNFTYYSAFAAE